MSNEETTGEREDGPVYGMFGLTYAAYLVWPRLLMSNMPLEWQERFAKLASEFDKQYGRLADGNYEVNLLARFGELIDAYEECGECNEGSVEDPENPGTVMDCPRCDGSNEDPDCYETRYETAGEIGRVHDWRTDYRRGANLLKRKLAEQNDNNGDN